MQKTINVNGKIIKIRTHRKTRQGNIIGITVHVNEKEYFYATFNDQDAMDKGYVKYVKEQFYEGK